MVQGPMGGLRLKVEGTQAGEEGPGRVLEGGGRGSAETLIFAQQPRPNDKRNPLLHDLRTAGVGGGKGSGKEVRARGMLEGREGAGVVQGTAHGRTRTNTDAEWGEEGRCGGGVGKGVSAEVRPENRENGIFGGNEKSENHQK